MSHDHIVTIHAVEESAPRPYLVMQYVAGLSLQQRLDRDGPLDLQEILRIGMQTASGLAAAHAQGLVHRDIKPANILLENGVERVKVTDFGLARAFAEASLTQSGVVAGTPQYMSPEQARGDPVDQRTDLFSLGGVLYAMCTGRAPFRGSNSMSVLKRVCEETPPPIRATNPEIPDWLIAVIDKLQAKVPAERYQSAAEVAGLLGEHLAHPHQGSEAAMPATVAAPHVPQPAGKQAHRGRWLAAAAALLVAIGGLALTEATGVTGILASLTGAGAGSAVTGHDPGPTPTPVAPDPPFVILTRDGLTPRKYDTLAEAVLSASDGDTIEIRGNGPFVTEAVEIHARTLTIRAADGFRPVICLSPQASQGFESILSALGDALVLEGLEFQRLIQPQWTAGEKLPGIVTTRAAALHIANCRFRQTGTRNSVAVWAGRSPLCELRNCELFSKEGGVIGWLHPGARVIFDNNCLLATGGIGVHVDDPQLNELSIQFTRNTCVSRNTFFYLNLHVPLPPALEQSPARSPIRLEVSGSIFDAPFVLGFTQTPAFLEKAAVLEPAEAEATLLRLLEWRGERNVFAAGSTSVGWIADTKQQPSRGPKTLEEWKRFWGAEEADSLEGRLRFRGGDLLSRTGAALDQLTPDDFRLRPDSAGYRAGKDGKDLGADVDLVGPGPAYERWKKTPAYQQWLKETGQVKGRD